MAVSCSSKIEDVLDTALNKLNSRSYTKLNIVIGNESCDLDSAVSSIVYAIFLHWQHNQIKCNVCTKDKRDEADYKDDVFIPLLNVIREDYELKTEVLFCLKKHNINKQCLLFRDDLDLKELISLANTNIILVDHHVLSIKDKFLAPRVIEIIDHRPIDKTEWPYREDTRSTIEVVGSCCTLIAQRIKDLSALMSKDSRFFQEFRDCTDMLYSTIILDTVNCSKDVNKATPHDEDMLSLLENFLKFEDCEAERKRKLSELVDARRDVSNLNAVQLLKKDVKVTGDIFVPSFPILVKEFFQKPNALEALTEVLQRSNCSVALLLGMDLTNTVRRDTAVYSINDRSRSDKLAKLLEGWIQTPLHLTKEHLSEQFIYYKQLNLSASRKQYMPAVMQFLNEK